MRRYVVNIKKRKKKSKTAEKLKIINLKSSDLSNLGTTGLNQLIKPNK